MRNQHSCLEILAQPLNWTILKPRDRQWMVTATSNQRGSTRHSIRCSSSFVVILGSAINSQKITLPTKNAIFVGTVVELCHQCQRMPTTPARDLSIPAGPSPKARGPPEIPIKRRLLIFLSNSSCHDKMTKSLIYI